MKRVLIPIAIAAAMLHNPAVAADVGVSVSIGQPGFYGRLDIGGYPPPVLLYPQPVVIQRAPVLGPPLYLRVPPGHSKHWSKHCREYNACGEQVYFVRDDWYNREYVPRYREHHGEHRGYDRDDDRRNDRRYDDDRGRGHGHGHDRDR